MKKCIHKLNIGFEPTFGYRVGYTQANEFYEGKTRREQIGTELRSVYDWGYGTRQINAPVFRDVVVKLGHKEEMNKIGFTCYGDSETYECPSVLKRFNTQNAPELYQQYHALIDFFAKKKIRPSIAYEGKEENDGGGHMHLSMYKVNQKGRKFKVRFLRNLYHFAMNNPELNWVFNGPWDRDNANSMIGYHDHWDDDMDYNNFIDQFEEDNICKEYPIINREDIKTVEFRFFSVPRNTAELELHFNLTISIYNYIWKITSKNTKIETIYKNVKDIQKIKRKNAEENIIKTLTAVKMPLKDIDLTKEIKFPFFDIRYGYNGMLV
jgi:hypothetical protein